jgi:diguanylate cyclase (GGDEF)-like protein
VSAPLVPSIRVRGIDRRSYRPQHRGARWLGPGGAGGPDWLWTARARAAILAHTVGLVFDSSRRLSGAAVQFAARIVDRITSISLALLVVLVVARLVAGAQGALDWLMALAVAGAVGGWLAQGRSRQVLAQRERAGDASFTHLLQRLSRSISPDAIVAAIVDALRGAAGVDHVVIARLRPTERLIEATLVSASWTVAPATMQLPAEVLAPRTPGGPPVTERLVEQLKSAYGLRHVLAQPLIAEKAPVGVLLLSRRTAEAWTSADRELLTVAAGELSAALERAYAHQAAEARARLDALTGLPNRRHFDELADVLAQGRRAGDALGVLMIDIDHFKRLNDRHGHATGDAVLRAIARAVATAVRLGDTPARYGGEEFAVILRRASAEQAMMVAARIQTAVAAVDLAVLGVAVPVTVSIGVAVGAERGLSIAALVGRADKALCEAKRAGRDRVVMDGSTV